MSGVRVSRGRRAESGQAHLETSLVVTVLVLLMLGVLEFGRAFVIVNVVQSAARVGARAVATAPSYERDLAGYVVDTARIEAQVRDELRSAIDEATVAGFEVLIRQTRAEPPLAQVTVSGSIPYLFHWLGREFGVDRTVNFRDEGRP